MTGYNTDKIKVIIADDHPLLRRVLLKYYRWNPEYKLSVRPRMGPRP